MKTKLLSLFLVVGVTISVFTAGCGKTGANEESTSTQSSTQSSTQETKSAEKFQIEVSLNDGGTKLPAADSDFVKQELDKALNIDLKMANATGDDYFNQINIRMASGSTPDYFQVRDRATMQQFVNNGALLELTPYMDKLKDYKQFVGDAVLKKTLYQGKTYVTTKASSIAADCLYIRKDWLDVLNLKMPTTIDELLDVAKAFTEKDPDGNGKKDTYGLTGVKLHTFRDVFGGYGIGINTDGIGTDVLAKNGQLTSTIYDSNMKDALSAVKKFTDAGVVDPEIMVNKSNTARDKAIQGRVGILASNWADITKDETVAQYKAVNPKANWVPVGGIKGPVGTYCGLFDVGKAGSLYAIPKSMEKNPAKLQRIFDLINYVSTKDGNQLVDYGIKGRHYNIQDGKVVATELMAKESGYTYLYQFTGRPELEYLQTKFPNQAKDIDFGVKVPKVEVLTGYVDMPDGYNNADVNKYFEEEITKFVYGKRPISEYDSFVKTLDTTYNYKKFYDTAQEQLKALGYVK